MYTLSTPTKQNDFVTLDSFKVPLNSVYDTRLANTTDSFNSTSFTYSRCFLLAGAVLWKVDGYLLLKGGGI